MKKIVAISGSTRQKSTNESILSNVANMFQGKLDVHLYQDMDQLPHFNPDLTVENVPASIQQFRNRIAAADGVLICTPEYVFSLPAVLKNALEWMVSTTIFSDKPTAIIVASASGEKAFESLNLILTTLEANMHEESKLLIRGAKSKINQDGQFSDKETEKQITQLMLSLIDSMRD